MRIISNLGDVDISYEYSSIIADQYGCIHAYSSGIHGKRIGRYNDRGEALIVMEQIRDAYNNGCFIFKMPKAKEVEWDEQHFTY